MKTGWIVAVAVLGMVMAGGCQEQVGEIETPVFSVRSHSIDYSSTIGEKYSRNGGNVSPQLEWVNVPDGTRSFVIVVDDPDAEPVAGKTWVHWNVFLKDANVTEIFEGASGTNGMPEGSLEGTTSGGLTRYEGPNPPTGQTHTYYFCVYAMSTTGIPAGVTVNSSFTRTAFKAKFESDILDVACVTGKYTGK